MQGDCTGTIRMAAREEARARALRWLAIGWAWFSAWRERARSRRQLLTMDDHLLKDIGVTRHEAEYEARQPFWRI